MPNVRSKPPKSILRRRLFGRLVYFFKSSSLLLLILVVILGAMNVEKIKDFLVGASGENASLVIDTKVDLGEMPKPWRNLAQGGESHDWRIEPPLQDQVQALGPEYIRIDHVYDFHEIVSGSPGNLQFDFSKLDLLIDDILAVGAKPYIALSYMPSAITTGDIVSAPSDYLAWQEVVQRTIEHISGTRGISDVYYEVWNEPDLFGDWKTRGNKNYLDLYTFASRGAQSAKNVQPFKLGGPSTTALYKNWFNALAKEAVESNLRLDFISWHLYSEDVDQFRRDMADAQKWLQSYPELANVEFNITEWGHESDLDSGYDNNYSAAHTVAVSIEMVGVINRAFIFEVQDGKDPSGEVYWGRWGLFTHNDFGAKAKPRLRGLRMLDQIGENRLQLLGKGSWVKALAAKNQDGDINVVLANFDKRGRHSEEVPIMFTGLEPGNYTITKEFLDGRKQTEQLNVTESGQIQTTIFMATNSVATVEVVKE